MQKKFTQNTGTVRWAERVPFNLRLPSPTSSWTLGYCFMPGTVLGVPTE